MLEGGQVAPGHREAPHPTLPVPAPSCSPFSHYDQNPESTLGLRTTPPPRKHHALDLVCSLAGVSEQALCRKEAFLPLGPVFSTLK